MKVWPNLLNKLVQIQNMADEEDGDIEVQAEEEEEVGENFQDTELELLDGDREGTKWLVINGVHIC